jgi:hypothetical protein
MYASDSRENCPGYAGTLPQAGCRLRALEVVILAITHRLPRLCMNHSNLLYRLIIVAFRNVYLFVLFLPSLCFSQFDLLFGLFTSYTTRFSRASHFTQHFHHLLICHAHLFDSLGLDQASAHCPFVTFGGAITAPPPLTRPPSIDSTLTSISPRLHTRNHGHSQ